MSPEESAIDRSEFLLRRIQSDPARFLFPDGPFQYQSFLPNSNDEDGLSLNREGDHFETAQSLLQKSANEKVREFGGIVAVKSSSVMDLGLDISVDPQVDSLGHCLIKEMSRTIYDGSKEGKRKIKELADRLARGSHIRIKPRPIPQLN
jgi:hypothetical protein